MKSNNPFIVRFAVFIAVFLLVVGTGIVWWRDAVSPAAEGDSTPVLFVVPRGQSVKEISRRLANERLVRSQIAFYLLVKVMGLESRIQAGDFRLNRTMPADTIARELTHGMLDVWVTMPEGWRAEEVASLLARELSIPEKEFLSVADEGYMFPDTYLVPRDATAGGIVSVFRENFDKKVTAQLREDAKRTGLPFEKVMVVASLVEREGKSDSDRPVIAGILYNRLAAEMPLQIDATLQYALGYQSRQKTWWKKDLTNEDKTVDSPYNTYIHVGLPPGPIANPGLGAIKAAIYPEKSEYLYYLHDATGTAHYAKTLEGHEANIAKYLR